MKLVQTCGACPEQYDVFDDAGEQVGYIRLRHGYLSVRKDGPGGDEVFGTSSFAGDGCFDRETERKFFLDIALKRLKARHPTEWFDDEHVVCPHCSDRITDLWEFDFGHGDEVETDCPSCGKSIAIAIERTATYGVRRND